MPNPMHLHAPASTACVAVAAHPRPGSLLDDWSCLSYVALPVLACAEARPLRLWSRLFALTQRRLARWR